MPNSKKLFLDTVSKISPHIDRDEAESIVYFLFDRKLGLTRSDILLSKETNAMVNDEWLRRINQHEPVQYIVGEEFFAERWFKVNPDVLIPRPETEELVREAARVANEQNHKRVWDIGTGSGCIAISLAWMIPSSDVFATDASAGALETARANAKQNNVQVEFRQHNILNEPVPFSNLDMIVSNPPYIRRSEAAAMSEVVKDFEPSMALFVPDDDPLLFCRAIADVSTRVLKRTGSIFVEINAAFGEEVKDLFAQYGFETTVHKDMAGKDRIASAKWQK